MATNETFSIHGYNLVTLLKRLEAATSRLEDVTIFQEQSVGAETTASKSIEEGESGQKAIEGAPAVAVPEEKKEVKEEVLPPSIKEFDNIITDSIKPFVELSNKIDSVVGEQAELFEKAILEERKFLLAASKSKKVELSDPIFAESIKPISELMAKIGEVKDANRTSKYSANLNAVAEGVAVLGWICTNTPVSLIPDFKESAQFWTNRVLKEFKESDPNQVEWVKVFLSIFDTLKSYAKEFHTTGVTFNANGGSLKENLTSSSASAPAPAPASAPASAGGAPPPPPPPPASVFEVKETASKPAAPAGGFGAVFGELNKGSEITAGLKKVDKSQMTHKNPALRGSSVVPAKKEAPIPPKKPTSLSKAPSTATTTTVKPPKKVLEDGKWMIANYESSNEIITIEGEMQQSVFITNCNNVVIQIKGKVNTITLNQCNKIGLVVDSTVSGIDYIKCKKFELQIIELVPTVSIDQSDDGSIYLSKKSLTTEIYTSSTTSLNVNVPNEKDESDITELPIPEQFKHTFVNGKITSTIVEHSG